MELAAKLFASADLSTGPAEGLTFSWWREGWVLWLQPEPRQVEEQGEWQGEHSGSTEHRGSTRLCRGHCSSFTSSQLLDISAQSSLMKFVPWAEWWAVS